MNVGTSKSAGRHCMSRSNNNNLLATTFTSLATTALATLLVTVTMATVFLTVTIGKTEAARQQWETYSNHKRNRNHRPQPDFSLNNERITNIDAEELNSLGISSEDIMMHLRHLSDGNYNCGRHTMMMLHYVRNKTVTCNDGSPSGYYMRRSLHSTKWMVYLDGGWFCFDEDSCRRRWQTNARLMSSYDWTISRTGSGILSANQLENPYMYDVNTVVVPYCSSDAWSGTRQPRTKNDFAFMGALILEEVIRDLVYAHGLAEGSSLFVAGSSAGGTGVLINLDRIAGVLAYIAPRVQVRGIVDSGWFLDNQQYEASECRDVFSCSPTASIQRGMKLWQGNVPETCRKQYTDSDEIWRCYFGYRVYPTLKTPVFVIQHLFDQAQITADNVGSPVNKQQWKYIHDLGRDMRHTLNNVSAVFAPACLAHILLTGSDWASVSVRGATLPEAIHCWEASDNERNLYSRHSRKSKAFAKWAEQLITGDQRNVIGSSLPRAGKLQADSPRQTNHRHRHNHGSHSTIVKKASRKKHQRKRERTRKLQLRQRLKAEKKAKRKREKKERRKKKRGEKLQTNPKRNRNRNKDINPTKKTAIKASKRRNRQKLSQAFSITPDVTKHSHNKSPQSDTSSFVIGSNSDTGSNKRQSRVSWKSSASQNNNNRVKNSDITDKKIVTINGKDKNIVTISNSNQEDTNNNYVYSSISKNDENSGYRDQKVQVITSTNDDNPDVEHQVSIYDYVVEGPNYYHYQNSRQQFQKRRSKTGSSSSYSFASSASSSAMSSSMSDGFFLNQPMSDSGTDAKLSSSQSNTDKTSNAKKVSSPSSNTNINSKILELLSSSSKEAAVAKSKIKHSNNEKTEVLTKIQSNTDSSRTSNVKSGEYLEKSDKKEVKQRGSNAYYSPDSEMLAAWKDYDKVSQEILRDTSIKNDRKSKSQGRKNRQKSNSKNKSRNKKRRTNNNLPSKSKHQERQSDRSKRWIKTPKQRHQNPFNDSKQKIVDRILLPAIEHEAKAPLEIKISPDTLRSKRSFSTSSSIVFDQHDVHHMKYHKNQCSHHSIDHCEWPQCNPSCPKFINHYTGEEVDFIDVLMQFGLDISSIASSLNLDEQTVYHMDRNQLISLLVNM